MKPPPKALPFPSAQQLREQAQGIQTAWGPRPPEAYAALLESWRLVLERIELEGKQMDLSAIHTLSGILQKLASSQKQLQELATKEQEQATKEAPGQPLDAVILKELEQELKLL